MSKLVIGVKKRVVSILVWILLSAAVLLPVRAEELLLLEEEDVLSSDPTVLSIANVNTLPSDIPGVTFRGTVVWAEGETVIAQEGDDSIWVSVPEMLSPGEVVLVSGQTGQEAFLAETVTVEGTGPLPAMEAGGRADHTSRLRAVGGDSDPERMQRGAARRRAVGGYGGCIRNSV